MELANKALKLCPYNPESPAGRLWIMGFLEPNSVSDFGSKYLDEGRKARSEFDV
jgi:hypothetical protein